VADSMNSGGTHDLSAVELAVATDLDGRHRAEGDAELVVLLLTIDQAATALAVPRSWLRDKVTARQVPHTRLGRHVCFSAEHLRLIIQMGEESGVVGPIPTRGRPRRRRAGGQPRQVG
jgi:excisionase family DNA binding protein